ncbi:MAG: endonuclease/exonuclease/phosphatase family protein [Pseudomonadota bacterium]
MVVPLRTVFALLLLGFGLVACGEDGAERGAEALPPLELPAPAGDALRIAVWNVEHLAAPGEDGCIERDATDFAVIRRYLDGIEADVWLLQEVESEATLAHVFGDEGWSFHVDRRPSRPGPACREDPDRSLGMLRTAVVVRDGVDHRRLADLAALDLDGDGRLRPGVHVRLTGDVRLDLLSIHLKSGCFEERIGRTRYDCPILFAQAEALEAWLDDLSAAGRAVVVGGDFNRRLEVEGDPIWAGLDDGDPVALHLAGAGIDPECDARYTEFIDFLLLNEAARELQIEGSFQEVTFDESWQRRPSDHCPLVVDLQPRS